MVVLEQNLHEDGRQWHDRARDRRAPRQERSQDRSLWHDRRGQLGDWACPRRDRNGRDCARIDAMLLCVQNDLFDLGADLCVPLNASADSESLRIVQSQVDRLERKIDELNAELAPLRSFVLPGGSPAAAALHLARTITRRAERLLVALAEHAGRSRRRPGAQICQPAIGFSVCRSSLCERERASRYFMGARAKIVEAAQCPSQGHAPC